MTGESTMRAARQMVLLIAIVSFVDAIACGGKKPPVARPAPPPTATTTGNAVRTPSPPEPVGEPTVVPPEPVRDDAISSASLDDLNRSSPLKPVFFELDSSDLNSAGQK